ncbi:MAG TPA: glutamate-1-semialdehyde 2,1-aminomutase [Candidatus Dormibacteraeota bacterium]
MTQPDQLLAEARALFPGGVNSPVRAYKAVGGEPPLIERGHGATIWDTAGNRYLDLVGAYGPLVVGHARSEVVAAVARAAEAGGPYGLTSPGEVRLGQLIRARMPAVERLRFVSSGTEAAMSALRVARAATGRELIVKFDGGYHGHADSLLVEAGSGAATLSLPGSAGIGRAGEATLVARYNDLDSVERLLAGRRGQVAALIVEPVAANMGVVVPEPDFLTGLRQLCTAHGALLIFDEVITGFRVAPGGAQELYGVRPDLTVLGKIIGGGFPVGAYGGRADLMDLVAPSGPVYQAGTLSGHPVVMAAGAATLELLDRDAYARLDGLGARLGAGLEELGWAVGRCGSLLTPFAAARPPRDFAEAKQADLAAYARLFNALRAGGVLPPPSQFEAWFLSTAHGEADVDRVLEVASGDGAGSRPQPAPARPVERRSDDRG